MLRTIVPALTALTALTALVLAWPAAAKDWALPAGFLTREITTSGATILARLLGTLVVALALLEAVACRRAPSSPHGRFATPVSVVGRVAMSPAAVLCSPNPLSRRTSPCPWL